MPLRYVRPRAKVALCLLLGQRTVALHPIRVTQHKDCVAIVQSDFLSDETKNAANTVCICEYFCEV